MHDHTQRFTDRAEAYVRHRPGYPAGVLDFLRSLGLLTPGCRVADVGSGTGISAALLMSAGANVIGVEPNAAMRAAAEARLEGDPLFRSVPGSAEATTLPDRSVDLVTAGQAFHWFDQQATRAEFQRILRPGGGAALFWNTRLLTGSRFAIGYEELLCRYATDYARVRHDAVRPSAIADFFAPQVVHERRLPSSQRFDYEGLRGRLLSSSYAPTPDDPRYEPMLNALRTLFDACEVEGAVEMRYQTEVYAGVLRGA